MSIGGIFIKSMTGYGVSNELMFGREIAVEIKSVNSRYLDLSIKTPKIYGFLDEQVKKVVTKNIARGKVEVSVFIKNSENTDTCIEINQNMLEKYLSALNEISAKYNVPNKVDNVVLSKIPEVITVKKTEENQDEIIVSTVKILEHALEKYNKMRTNEAIELKKDIIYKKDLILDLISKIEEKSDLYAENYRAKMFVRLKEILQDTQISEDRILMESAIFADKTSVDEEVVRLKSHILQLEEMLEIPEPIGRKLDFLVQEINREINTIGSKANDIEVSKMVIDLKALVEKIREQIQNIE